MFRFRISVKVVVNVRQIIYAIMLAYMLLPSISQNLASSSPMSTEAECASACRPHGAAGYGFRVVYA